MRSAIHSAKIKVEIGGDLRDKTGRIIKQLPYKRANSLLKGFIQLLAAQMSQANQTIKDITGTDRTASEFRGNLRCNATTETNIGIVIGTGTAPVTMTDHKLETQITTNIAHQTVIFALENPDINTWRLAITRPFTNNTGATLGVREIGLYAEFSGNYYRICIDRTLYNVDVPHTTTLTMTYRITITK